MEDIPEHTKVVVDESILGYLIFVEESKKGILDNATLKCQNIKEADGLSLLMLNYALHVRTVCLTSCDITDEYLSLILSACRSMKCLEVLDLCRNQIGSDGSKQLSNYLPESSVKVLKLSKNRLCNIRCRRGKLEGEYDSSGLCALLQAIAANICIGIEFLDISGNLLGQDKSLTESICNLILSRQSLTLDITGNYFDPSELCHIRESVNGCPNDVSCCGHLAGKERKSVKMVGRNLTTADLVFLSSALGQSELNQLDLSWNMEVGDFPFDFHNNGPFSKLNELRLSNISMSPEFASSLRDYLLSPCCILSMLDVSNNAATLNHDGFNHLLMGIKDNKTVVKLDLKACIPESYSNYQLLESSIAENSSLEILNISQSTNCNFDAKSLFRSLKRNVNIKSLCVSHCEITGPGLTELEGMFKLNSRLVHLDLSHNFICKAASRTHSYNAPAVAALRALCDVKNPPPSPDSIWHPISFCTRPEVVHLRSLDLSYNKMDHGVMDSLCEALKNESLYLKSLSLCSCGIPPSGGSKIANVIPMVKHMESLDISNNSMQADGLKSILFAVADNASLKVLNLDRNFEKPVLSQEQEGEVIAALKFCLMQNPTIARISLKKNHLFGVNVATNPFNASTVHDLAEAIKFNAAIGGNLTALDISHNSLHSCMSESNFWGPDQFRCHTSWCSNECPAVLLSSVVSAMENHPKLATLFGVTPGKTLRVDAGCSAGSPLMWALFKEISNLEKVKKLEISAGSWANEEVTSLGYWIVANSLLTRVVLSNNKRGYSLLHKFRRMSFQSRMGTALFVRGCAYLGSNSIRNVLEYLYGPGEQSRKFIPYLYPLS